MAHQTLNLYNFSRIGYEDVLHMSNLTVDEFLENIKIRYGNGLFYTYIGEVCVSVNPNRSGMSIYGSDYMDLYCGKPLYQLPPHIFAIADSAYHQTFENNQNSCVIITGESGSGKTEASKLLLLYITHVIKKNELSVQDKISSVETIILRSNCILEAFGNACTLRNHNSSRFGKYTEISFCRDNLGKTGFDLTPHFGINYSFATIHNYLLEKSRVIAQQDGERNFHIFYQLLAGLNTRPDLYQLLNLTGKIMEYRYLSSRTNSVLNTQDKTDFDLVIESMNMIGFTSTQIESIFRILASILHLGNVQFALKENCNDYRQCVAESASFTHFCEVLQLDETLAAKTLCSRTIHTPTETMIKTYSKEQAIYGQDALAKTLYERLFGFIIAKVNHSLGANRPTGHDEMKINTIGILDIYGFEVFSEQHNSFEQFLINYCNEKLHQLFVDRILNKEQQLYDLEDIEWKMVEYNDNLAICRLLDEPHHGILALLDEACTSGQPYTDQLVLQVFHRRFAGHPHFQSRSINSSQRNFRPEQDFTIRHYAGDVRYSIIGFVDKNMDLLYRDYREMISTIGDTIIREIVTRDNEMKQMSNKRPTTTGFDFRKSMSELTTRLSTHQQFYIRCIKPSDELNSERFSDDKVRHQIQYLGLIQNALVRKAGFWRQIPYAKFCQRYSMLAPCHMDSFACDVVKGDLRSHYMPKCTQILQALPGVSSEDFKERSKFAFGKNIIFLRDPQTIESLEQKRYEYLQQIVIKIQTQCRFLLARKRFERLKLARSMMEELGFLKTVECFGKIFSLLEQYQRQYSIGASNPAMICNQLSPIQVLPECFDSCPLGYNKAFCANMPQLTCTLSQWLIVLKHPLGHWNEKLLRLDAAYIFKDRKSQWGEERARWFGNYLASPITAHHYAQFRELFSKNPKSFSVITFSSYVMKTNRHNLEVIRGLVMTSTDLYKVDIDSMTFKRRLAIVDIEAVSVTPSADQLVVIHSRHPATNDLVFSFCSLKRVPRLTISTAKLLFDTARNGTKPDDHKVGEFVTILAMLYARVTGTTLPIRISDSIEFRCGEKLRKIESIKRDDSLFLERFSGFGPWLRSWFTWKGVRDLYWSFKDPSLLHRDRLSSKVEFRKASPCSYALIYDA